MMMTVFLEQLFATLNRRFVYTVLRNHNGLPFNVGGRDIDILIKRGQLSKICSFIAELEDRCNCRILYTQEDNQFLSVILLDASAIVFQLDFQYNFAWMGIDLLDERDVLKCRKFNGHVYHLNAMYTFLPKYLYCRILGAKYPEKYSSVQEAAVMESGVEIDMLLRKLSLNGGGIDFWNRAGKWNLRFRCIVSSLVRRPFRALFHAANFLFFYIKNLFVQRGLMISFTGPDGCGKTTVIDLLTERLNVNPPFLFHFRPSVLPNLGEVGVKTGIKKDVDRNYSAPHRGKKHGKLNSLIRLFYYSTDYIFGYWIKILPLRQRKHIVFFDRYYSDIIVDHERSGIFLGHKFLTWWRHFVPACQYNFFFRVAPDTILSRKQELSREAIECIYSRMEYLASIDRHCFWIDNNGPPEDAVRQILTIIAEHQHKKYAKSL